MKRIGILIPESNLIVEEEISELLFRIRPFLNEEVKIHFGKLRFETRFKDSPNDFFNEICFDIERHLILYDRLKFSSIGFFCNSASLILNNSESQNKTRKSINDSKFHKTFFDSFTATIDFLKLNNISSIDIINPYSSKVNQQVITVIEKNNDIDINSNTCINLTTSIELSNVKLEELSLLIEPIISNYSKSQLLVLLCTNFPTLDLFEQFPLSIISNNLALFYRIISNLGVFESQTNNLLNVLIGYNEK